MTATGGFSHFFSLIPAGAPWWLSALMIGGLALHIGGGTVGIISGWGAVLARKGSPLHIRFGKIFLGAMLTMAGAALALGIYLKELENIGAASLTIYCVTTAWLAAHKRDGRIGGAERLAAVAAFGVGLLFLYWGTEASRLGKLDGFSPTPFYIFAGIAGFFTLIDLNAIRRGVLNQTQRIARHLWRMCFAFLVASGSFFLGQQKIMPHAWHGAAVLWMLGLAPLGFLLFWLVRVQFRPWRAARVAAAA